MNGRSDVIVNLCAFHIQIESKDDIQTFLGRRPERLEQCRQREKQRKKITRAQSYV